MQILGQLTRWDDQRGFGFITPLNGGQEIFVHISALKGGQRPIPGEWLEFAVEQDAQGKKRAVSVRRPASKSSQRQAVAGKTHGQGQISLWPLGLFAFFLLAWMLFGKLSRFWLFIYGATSLISFILYAWDKSAAQSGRWRTPEATLHLWALLGGWPGALLAQKYLRHKSVKPEFRSVFRMSIVLNVVVFIFLASPQGQGILAGTVLGRI